VIEILILIVFFGGLVVGGLVTDGLGSLPSAEELQEEDQARLRTIEHEA
jgi:hypothetical protein